jgi:hypothetical protein
VINFKTSKEDAAIIKNIALRMQKLASEQGESCDTISVMMDISACHVNGTPLKLQELLNADDFNFVHDVAGISRHIDRNDSSPTGGQLNGFFLPRFAA